MTVARAPISIEEFGDHMGREMGVSDWILIDQERIDRFADITEDWQFIHIDPIRARESLFGGTIAHGYLTLSLLSAMASSSLPTIIGSGMAINYGMNSLRFLSPVRSGKRVRGRFKLKGFFERSPGKWQTTVEVAVEIEDQEKPALVAEWVTVSTMAA
jgi:acyl dehydratase